MQDDNHADVPPIPAPKAAAEDDLSALEQRRTERVLMRYARTMEGVFALTREVNRAADLKRLLDRAALLLADNPGVRAGGVYLYNKSARRMDLARSFGPVVIRCRPNPEMAVENAYVRTVITAIGKPLLFAWGQGAEFYFQGGTAEDGAAIAAATCVGGEVLGLLTFILGAADDQTMAFLEVAAAEVGGGIKRKKAEEALKRSEEYFRSIYENAILGLYRSTAEGRIVMANPALVRMLGFGSFEEIQQVNFGTDPIGPTSQWAIFKERLERENEITGLESEWRRRDGTSIYVRESAKAVRDSTGRTLYFEGLVEDISDRKRLEAERDNERSRAEVAARELQAIFDNCDIVLWSIREDARGDLYYDRVNEAFAAVEGNESAYYNGRRIVDIATPGQMAAMRQRIDVVKGGQTSTYYLQRTVGTKELHFVVKLIPLVEESGEVRRVIGSAVDITDLKTAEGELARHEELTRTIVERAPIGISVRSRTGKLLIVNEAWKKIWGVSTNGVEADLARDRRELLFDEYDDYLGAWLPNVRAIYERGGWLHIPEVRIPKPRPGGAEWVSQYFYGIQEPGGAVDRVVILTEDITARKADDRALEELKRAKESLTDLVVNDIGSMSAPLISWLGLLRDEMLGPINDEQRDALLRLIERSGEIKALSEELLEISRAKEGGIELDRKPFILEDQVGEVILSLKSRAERDGKKVEPLFAGGPIVVNADAGRVRRVLANYLSCALDNAASGDGIVSINVNRDETGEWARVRIIYNGPFPARRTSPPGGERYPDTGRDGDGLYTGRDLKTLYCKMAVEAHGGKISIEGTGAIGTIITFTLPLYQNP